MGQRFYDGNGKLVGRQISDQEAADQALLMFAAMGLAAAGAAIAAVVAIALAPIAPVFLMGYAVFQVFDTGLGWHELPSGVLAFASIVAALFLLCRSKVVRITYFGAEVIVLGIAAYVGIESISDWVWGGFVAGIVMLLAGALVYYVEKNMVIEKQLKLQLPSKVHKFVMGET